MAGSLFPILHSVYFNLSPFFNLITSLPMLFCVDSLVSNFTGKMEDRSETSTCPQDISPSLSITKVGSGSHCFLPSYGDCYADYPSNIFNLFQLIWNEISRHRSLISSSPSQTSLKLCLHFLRLLSLSITQFTLIWPHPMSAYWNGLPITKSVLIWLSPSTVFYAIVPFFQIKIFFLFHWFPWHHILPVFHFPL